MPDRATLQAIRQSLNLLLLGPPREPADEDAHEDGEVEPPR